MGPMTTQTADTDEARPLRADAVRNRELILATAGYDEIARRAGIGVGTVYRRFPQRAELVQALFESRIWEIVAIAEEAGEKDDAFEGLAWFLERALERQVADRGLKEVLVSGISEADHRTMGRERIAPIVDQLVQRAQESGSLRQDVAATDIGMQLMVISSMTTAAQPELWRRYLALLLDGLRSRPDQAALPLCAPGDDAMHDLMCHMQGR
jgi:AcrR family transcriptional regulator